MKELAAQLESILFLSSRPISFKKLAKLLEVSTGEVKNGLQDLAEARNVESSGIHIIVGDEAAEMATNPAFADVLAGATKEERESALTRPQLETLTVIAYRSPITQPEIEHIRGVNCTVILRNLLMRGLIIEKKTANALQPSYTVSTEFLRALGLSSAAELPEFEGIQKHDKLNQLLQNLDV